MKKSIIKYNKKTNSAGKLITNIVVRQNRKQEIVYFHLLGAEPWPPREFSKVIKLV